MGFQCLFLVHQLVYSDSMQLPLYSVVAPVVVEDLVSAGHLPDTCSVHQAFVVADPEEEEVEPALEPVLVGALPPGSVHPDNLVLLANRQGRTAVAMSTGCSTS